MNAEKLFHEVALAFHPLLVSVESSGLLYQHSVWRIGDRTVTVRPSDDPVEVFRRVVDELLADGWERYPERGWVNRATADFLANEPHPVFL